MDIHGVKRYGSPDHRRAERPRTMVWTDPLTQIDEARRRDVPWHLLIEAVRRLETTSQADERGRPWIKVAAERSGYTIAQLRQMDRVMTMLQEVTTASPRLSLNAALQLPFSHLEMIARIAKVDRGAAERFLSPDEVASGYTYRAVRDFYYQARAKINGRTSPQSVGLQSARQFTKRCHELFSDPSNLRLLHGGGADPAHRRFLKWPGGFNYANPDFIIIDDTDKERSIDAIDCVTIFGDVNQDITVKEVLRSFTESIFFRHYFVCLPSYSPIWLFSQHRDRIRLDNIGVVEVGESSVELVAPPEGGPCPDRQKLLRDDAYVMGRIPKPGSGSG